MSDLKYSYAEKKNELIDIKDKSKNIQTRIEDLRKAEEELRSD